jgi:DNA/RNA-binding domain of Phe-tRNA-synthetase-like protein
MRSESTPPVTLTITEHPSLRCAAVTTTFGTALGETPSPDWLVALLKSDAPAPFKSDDALRTAVRDMLRVGGYKPTGRGKPASEYLIRAAGDGSLGTINAAVDACNAVSLHSGLPISVIDLDLARAPFRIAVAQPGESYVFNRTGQEIDLGGLLCVYDADGPCGNAVKDSQRTKTHEGTTRTLSVLWSCVGFEERLESAVTWYRDLLERCGGGTERI